MSSGSSSYENEAINRARQDSRVCLEDEIYDPPKSHLKYPKSALQDKHQDLALRDRSGNIQSAHPREKKQVNVKAPFDVSEASSYVSQSNSLESNFQTFTSPSDHPLDHIKHLTLLAKQTALANSLDTYAHIDNLCSFATGLANSLVTIQTSIQEVMFQYSLDHTLVQDTIHALRTSRSKLEAEHAQVQDLNTRLSGLRFTHMTAIAQLFVRKAEYEFRLDEEQKLREEYAVMKKGMDKMRKEREEELVGMTTEMWRVKVGVKEMFERSEWSLRDGMRRTGSEIDESLERLNLVMNAAVSAGEWGKGGQEEAIEFGTGEKTKLDHAAGLYTCAVEECLADPIRDGKDRSWSEMEEYTAGCGERTVDDKGIGFENRASEGRGSEATTMVTEDKEKAIQDFPYWHGGEYDFDFWETAFRG